MVELERKNSYLNMRYVLELAAKLYIFIFVNLKCSSELLAELRYINKL